MRLFYYCDDAKTSLIEYNATLSIQLIFFFSVCIFVLKTARERKKLPICHKFHDMKKA